MKYEVRLKGKNRQRIGKSLVNNILDIFMEYSRPLKPSEVYQLLLERGCGTTYASVRDAIFRLYNKGILKRVARGYYILNSRYDVDVIERLFSLRDPKLAILLKVEWSPFCFIVMKFFDYITKMKTSAYAISFVKFKKWCQRHLKIKIPENSSCQVFFWYLVEIFFKKYMKYELTSTTGGKQVLIDLKMLQRDLSIINKPRKFCISLK